MAEEEFDESTELLDQMDMALELFKDSLRQMRLSPQTTQGPIDEFNGLLAQMDMAVELFGENVKKMRTSATPAEGPTGADFDRFNNTERARKGHMQKSTKARREFAEFNREQEEPARR